MPTPPASSASRAIIVFARAPRAGYTKTRLIPALGAAGAAALYRSLLLRTLSAAARVPQATHYLYADEACALPALGALAATARADWTLRVQAEGTLGERMSAALAAAHASARSAVLIGSDIVDFETADLVAALDALEAGHDAVIGPAADGGYWLIGLSAPLHALFTGIDWGTAAVCAQTIARLDAAGVRWTRVAQRHDVDTPADLVTHAARLSALDSR